MSISSISNHPLPKPEPSPSSSSWTQVKLQEKYPRHSHTSTLIKQNYILTFGGSDGRTYQNQALLFDVQKNIYRPVDISNQPPKARILHTACLLDDNEIIVFGGSTGDEVLSDVDILTMYSYDPPMGEWRQMETNTNLKRFGHSAHIVGDQMIICGGMESKSKAVNQIWSLDLRSGTWANLPVHGEKMEKTIYHASVVFHDQIFFFREDEWYGDKKCYWKLDLNTMILKNLPNIQWRTVIRKYPATTLIGDKVYMFGNGGTSLVDYLSSDLFIYDIDADKCNIKQVAGLKQAARFRHTQVYCQGRLYILGGCKVLKEPFSDIWFLDIENNPEQQQQMNKNNEGETTEIFKPENSIYPGEKAMEEEKFIDIIFEVQGEEIKVHKAILTQRCKYFEKMFTSGMMESWQEKIRITDMKAETFKALIRYIYLEKLELTEEIASELLGIADQYLLPELRKECEEYLVECLTFENLAQRVEEAEFYQAQILREGGIVFTIKNLEMLSKSNVKEQLSKEFIVAVIKRLAQQR